MEIRGEEVLLPVSAVSAFPRPHWLQGRVLGSLSEPVYRSHNLRITYEDACKICAREQELAGLDILCDGAQYYEWEARASSSSRSSTSSRRTWAASSHMGRPVRAR